MTLFKWRTDSEEFSKREEQSIQWALFRREGSRLYNELSDLIPIDTKLTQSLGDMDMEWGMFWYIDALFNIRFVGEIQHSGTLS